MRKYEKPIAVVNSNLAEGVYAASGCYTATASIHQTPDAVSYTHLDVYKRQPHRRRISRRKYNRMRTVCSP